MKRLVIFTVLLALSFCWNCAAQLYVGNNYMYVADKYLFVKQDINLQSGGNIFLRNESQLLQGTAGISSNQGIGELSVFQEGTSNNYTYNYWCSPVGAASASVGNGNFGIAQLNRPTGVTTIASTPATILASNVLDGTSSSSDLSIAQRWIFKFLSASTYSQWFYVGSAPSIGAGEGFTMKGTSGTDATTVLGVQNNPGSKQRYDFRGKPNDGNIDVSTGAAGTMTLTGNPYPSAIDLNMFLTDAANTPYIDGTALFWEHNPAVASHYVANYQGGYGVYNGTTGIYTPATFDTYDAAGNMTGVGSMGNYYERRFCPVGQGFMVRAIASGSVQFKNSHRVFKKEGVANNSEFHRNALDTESVYGNYEAIPNVAGTDYTLVSKAPTPHIEINTILNNMAVRQVALCFLPDAVDGVDRSDSLSPDVGSNLPYDVYFYLGGTEYVNSATSFDVNKRFPLGFKCANGGVFRIQVSNFVNFSDTENVYLHDKATDTYYDIKNNYYEVILPAGVNNTRYEITFLNNVLHLDTFAANGFNVVQNNSRQTLTISNLKSVGLQSITLYDITGKLIFDNEKPELKSTYLFSTAGISDAVYVVKIMTTDNAVFAQKITVSNTK